MTFAKDRKSPPSGGKGNYEYSWSNIFTVFDFLRSIDMRPIVEVSFMPELLAEYTNKTVFHYKGILSPPKRFPAEAFRGLARLHDLVRHGADRTLRPGGGEAVVLRGVERTELLRCVLPKLMHFHGAAKL